MRILCRLVWIPHALMLYVDDAFMLLPKSVGPLVASAAIMLVSCAFELGQAGHWQRFDLDWLVLDFETGIVLLPPDKVESLLEALDERCAAKASGCPASAWRRSSAS